MLSQRDSGGYEREGPVLYIRCYGEPSLRKKAAKLEHITDEERQILEEMAKVMHSLGGVGLAATQVGINKQLMVVDVDNNLLKLANPCIIKKEGCQVMEEGCLSLPDIVVNVKRAKKLTLEALDLENKKIIIMAEDLLSRAIQHEVDHLQGRLIIDYLPWIKRLRLRKRLRALRKKTVKK